MKKCFKLMFTAIVSLAMFMPAQADILTVFDGYDYNEYVPVYGYYYDAENVSCQVIYPEDQIEEMTGAIISSVKFYIANDEGNTLEGGKVAVSIGVTDQDEFPSYAPTMIGGLTQVAEITMVPGETELVVNFDAPFVYTGGNLVISTTVTQSSGYSSVYFWGKETDFYASIYRLPNSGNVYPQGFGPKTTFEYVLSDDYAAVSTNEIAFGKLYPGEEASQTFTLKNLGLNAFTPVFGGIEAPFSITPAAAETAPGETVEYTVTFAPDELGDYAQTLTIDCGNAGAFEIALSGMEVEIPNVIPVCDGQDYNGFLPFYGYYYDDVTKGQMIYTEEMLTNVVGKKITSITFYPTAPMTFQGGMLQLSFKAVEQDRFTTYTALTDLTAVATVVPGVNDEELVFTLDEPYEYNGGNLALEVSNIVKGTNYPKCNFYGQTLDYTPSFYIYGSQNDKSKFIPKIGVGYAKVEEPEYPMGDVDHDGKVSITDVTTLINYLLTDVSAAPAEANVNGDSVISITDVTTLINFLLSGSWE